MYTKVIVGMALVLVVLAAGWLFQSKGQQHPPKSSPLPPEKAKEIYLGLRNLALTANSNLKNSGKPEDPVAVLMELNTGTGNATIVGYGDGTASIYTSAGGGYLGGGQKYPSIHQAALTLIAVAHRFQARMHTTKDYPLPQKGEVFFYVVTGNGVYTVSAPEVELNRRTHPLTELYAAGQDVITQYRLNMPQ